jgi:outer membrane murein-binding lipoprotein Lpp
MTRFIIAAMIVWCALLVGCGGPTVAQVRENINKTKQTVETLQAAADVLSKTAETSHDPAAIKAAAAALSALDIAKAELPELEAQLKELKDADPAWQKLLIAGWPVILAALKFIPGVGTAVGPVAELAWAMLATKEQKLADA